VKPAAIADGKEMSAAGAEAGCVAERVCREGKAQGIYLRESRRRNATCRSRVGGMALASHRGINL
jgi:hypothetical protein